MLDLCFLHLVHGRQLSDDLYHVGVFFTIAFIVTEVVPIYCRDILGVPKKGERLIFVTLIFGNIAYFDFIG